MKTLAAAGLLGAAFYTNIAVGLLVIGLVAVGCALIIWVQARHSLRALNELLAEKARAGHTAISNGRHLRHDGA